MTLTSILTGFLDAAGVLVWWSILGLVFWALWCALRPGEEE